MKTILLPAMLLAAATAFAANDPIAYYPMNGNFDDASGNGNNLTANSAEAQFSDDSAIKAGNKVYGPTQETGNGASGEIKNIDINKGLTVMGFYNYGGGGNNFQGTVFGFGTTQWNKAGYLITAPYGMLQGKAGTRGETFKFFRVQKGWYHLTLVIPAAESGEQGAFYVNGEKVRDFKVAYVSDFDSKFSIAEFDKAQGKNKLVDEVKVFNRALSAAEIAEEATTAVEKPAVPTK